MNRSILHVAPLALACLALACGSSDSVKVTPIAAGSQCPNGGYSITVNNGTPQIICNGTNGTNGSNGTDGANGDAGVNGTNGNDGSDGFTTLVQTTTLPVGDVHCPTGGEEIDSGLDNGANGGTANDGILQPGEITSTSYVCNGGGLHVGSTTPPTGEAGNSAITANGGTSSDAGTSAGGNGGNINIEMNNGTEGGHVKLFTTGAADPSFTFPAKPAVDLGANPATITANTTVGELESDAGPGTLYTDSSGNLYTLDGEPDGGVGGGTLVTGLSIAAGITLTKTPSDSNCSGLRVDGPCVNSGTIALDSSTGSSSTLMIYCTAYFGDTGSAITNNGADGVAGTGDSDEPTITNGVNSGGITLEATAIWNQGTLSANGGTGGNGGNGGNITFEFQENNDGEGGTPLYNTGAIHSHGGAGQAGYGGNGGNVDIYASQNLNNSGPIETNGGAGTTQAGSAGSIDLTAGNNYGGSLYNSGTLSALGGTADPACDPSDQDYNCAGGNGSSIGLYANNGALVTNASIATTGGGSTGGNGGNGGGVSIKIQPYTGSQFGNGSYVVPAGDMLVSGSIDTSGGPGVSAGSASMVCVSLDPGAQPNGQEISFLGYTKFDTSGGIGNNGNGGSAGWMQISNTYFYGGTDDCEGSCGDNVASGPGGSVINNVNLLARGGTGALTGGNGSYVSFSTQSQIFFSADDFENVINAGNIDVSGGTGANGGGTNGVYMYGKTGITNSAQLVSAGGVGSAGNGGGAGEIELTSDTGPVANSGTLDVHGATGTVNGGGAGEIQLSGFTLTESGNLIASGGAGTGTGGNGGGGGLVQINATGGGLSQVTATAPTGITVAGGAGGPASDDITAGTAGGAGQVLIDSWDVTSSWTH